MTRMKLLFAALVLAATVAAVPAANAQTVHFVGAGSSAMFQGFAVAAFNDFATNITPGVAKHWSCSTASGLAVLHDTRTPSGGSPPPDEAGNFWVVWNDNGGTITDIWAYLSIDSTVGVRGFLAVPKAKLLIGAAAQTTAGSNAVNQTNFKAAQPDETSLPAAVYNALGGSLGTPIQAGMTDIRPEDARLATYRSLGSPTDTKPANPPLFYSFALGYGPGPISPNPIKSGTGTSTVAATPVAFQLPGFNDPITGSPVPTTTKVIPIGEAPIVFLANRTNTSTGLGQVIGSQSAIGYTSDGSYYVRNVWTQHPFPPTSTYPSLAFPTTGFCSVVANQTSPQCHVTRRPVGNLFSGGDCEGDNSAFTWPLNAQTQGLRATVPNGTVFPITLYLREPLSGTMNVTEFTTFKRYGTVNGSKGVSAPFEKPPYISQETNVDPTANNPLNTQCPAKFGETAAQAASTEGKRVRGIGTGEVVNGVSNVGGVKNTADSIAYAFFSFSNVSKIGTLISGATKTNQPNYGYLMMDGIDPLFDNYENKITGSVNVEGEPLGTTNAGVTTNPGQPADPTQPLTWGLLPGCSEGTGSTQTCRASSIWGTNPSFPHLRDGSYPAWSELRAICDSAALHCDFADDSMGTEGLIRNFQSDIHNEALGGSPDVLPFSVGNAFGPGNNQGDVKFVREHYIFELANDANEASNTGANTNPTHNANLNRTSVHQANTLIDFHSEPCSGGAAPGTPVTSPLLSECGGDAGGFVVPFGSTLTTVQQ